MCGASGTRWIGGASHLPRVHVIEPYLALAPTDRELLPVLARGLAELEAVLGRARDRRRWVDRERVESCSCAIRAAAHEDINLITLLMTATAAGLQVMDNDGTWIDVEGNHEQIIVDSGDMIQNLTNGLFKSTTHRVVNPGDPTQRRFSMPMFVHPRNEIDLTPREEFVVQTGGVASYQSINAGEYLHQRLVEIGLASK